MYARVLKRIRDCVRARHYVMTLHAEEEMTEDGLTVFDIEGGILTGEIVERQEDHDTHTWKYLVRGRSLGGVPVEAVVTLSPTGKLVVITVYVV